MTDAFMIAARNRTKEGFGERRAPLGWYMCAEDDAQRLADPAVWESVGAKAFREALIERASAFPLLPAERNEEQRHVALFVHGAGTWPEAMARYAELRRRLFAGSAGLGLLVYFAWPSEPPAGGGPDREDARASGGELAEVLVDLHEHLAAVERRAQRSADPAQGCRAKISIVAQGIGGFVVQKALAMAHRRLHSPERISLINQLVLAGADLDNDLFRRDQAGDGDGARMVDLCWRIAALYSGRDQALGAAAGLRQIGRRRLGRSGLADRNHVFDNVFDLDVTPFVDHDRPPQDALLVAERGRRLLRLILQGVDREQLRHDLGDSDVVLY